MTAFSAINRRGRLTPSPPKPSPRFCETPLYCGSQGLVCGAAQLLRSASHKGRSSNQLKQGAHGCEHLGLPSLHRRGLKDRVPRTCQRIARLARDQSSEGHRTKVPSGRLRRCTNRRDYGSGTYPTTTGLRRADMRYTHSYPANASRQLSALVIVTLRMAD